MGEMHRVLCKLGSATAISLVANKNSKACYLAHSGRGDSKNDNDVRRGFSAWYCNDARTRKFGAWILCNCISSFCAESVRQLIDPNFLYMYRALVPLPVATPPVRRMNQSLLHHYECRK